MKHLVVTGILGLMTVIPGGAAVRQSHHRLPAPVEIRGSTPSTAWLREELLDSKMDRHVTKSVFELDYKLGQGITADLKPDNAGRLTEYYDGHLLHNLNRTDNPFLHNRRGAGFELEL